MTGTRTGTLSTILTRVPSGEKQTPNRCVLRPPANQPGARDHQCDPLPWAERATMRVAEGWMGRQIDLPLRRLVARA